MFVIFDLDGTLANVEHRLHHIKGAKKNWDAFFEACVDDTPIIPIIQIFGLLRSNGVKLEIWSGRSDSVRAKTCTWLIEHHLYPDQLLMRSDGDYRPDHELKELWLHQAIEAGHKPDLVFDDRSSLVEMWRRNGIQCCQVAPGEF